MTFTQATFHGPEIIVDVLASRQLIDFLERTLAPVFSTVGAPQSDLTRWQLDATSEGEDSIPPGFLRTPNMWEHVIFHHPQRRALLDRTPGEVEHRESVRRLMRALVRRAIRSSGALPLHAGLLRHHDSSECFCVVGGKRSGKTTTLLSCLRTGLFNFAANDDVLVRSDGRSLFGVGSPRSMSVRDDILPMFPELEPSMGAEVEGGTAFLPANLADRLGIDLFVTGHVRMLVYPEFDDDIDSSIALPLNEPNERVSRFFDNVDWRSGYHEEGLDIFFPEPQPPSSAMLRAVAATPAVSLRQNRHTIRDSPGILMDALLRSRP